MTEDLDVGFSKVWSEERTLFLDSLKDNEELTQQVLIAMADAHAFRMSANRARTKKVPKIPRDLGKLGKVGKVGKVGKF